MYQMSPYPIVGFTDRISIVRKTPQIIAGRISNSCTDTIIAAKVPARVGLLRKIDDNIEQVNTQGLDSANERLVSYRTPTPAGTMVGDFIRIPFGVRPNVAAAMGTPYNIPTYIWIDTPSGEVLLHWNGTKYIDKTQTYAVEQNGLLPPSWCLYDNGVEVACFDGNFICAAWPTGYRVIRTTGRPIDYRIIKHDVQTDEQGRIHHYTCYVEIDDKPGVSHV